MKAKDDLKLVVFGAGLIGERHARLVHETESVTLAAIVDPAPQSKTLAKQLDCTWFQTVDGLKQELGNFDGAIIATPNETHLDLALQCIDAGVPCLIEKPLAANSDHASQIVSRSRQMGIPVLVGHHRRHHEQSRRMHEAINNGLIGQPVAAQVTWMLKKPAEYFAAGDWRTSKSGGPVWINFIHEIDLLRYFLGEIHQVSAITSNALRGTDAEDTAGIVLHFDKGTIATILISDTTPSPWHFEGASGENPNIAVTGYDGMRIFGTKAAVEFPSLQLWQHRRNDGHWGNSITSETLANCGPMSGDIALKRQLKHFADIIRNNTSPLVSAEDGEKSVAVVEAIHKAAETGSIQRVETIHPQHSNQQMEMKA